MTQTEKIAIHLKAGHTIGAMQAIGSYRITRLAARIYELRQRGWEIATIWRHTDNGSRFAEYKLLKETTNA